MIRGGGGGRSVDTPPTHPLAYGPAERENGGWKGIEGENMNPL